MANILVLKSSILGQYSQSNALIDGYLAERQGDTIQVRDLATLNLPVLDGELAMGLRGGENLNERQQAVLAQSDELVAELTAPTIDRHKVVHETADLLFHVMVGLAACDVPIADVWQELGRRFGVSGLDEKAARAPKA